MVVNGEPEFNGDRTDEIINPLLVVEILLPSTKAYDRGKKFIKYRSIASFCEDLLVSQAEPYIEQYYNGDRQSSDRWLWQVCDRLDRAIVYEIVNGELIDVGNRSAKHGYMAII
jgi:Uma2 family endonuclease